MAKTAAGAEDYHDDCCGWLCDGTRGGFLGRMVCGVEGVGVGGWWLGMREQGGEYMVVG